MHLQGVTAGILRGSGRQKLGALFNFFCYYVIGLPVGIFLAFSSGFGTLGIWIGLAIADGLQVCYIKGQVTFTVRLLRQLSWKSWHTHVHYDHVCTCIYL